MLGHAVVFLVSFFSLCLSYDGDGVHARMPESKKAEITVTSGGFAEGGMIPKRYTCHGEDVSPSLRWTGIPKGAKSLALICEDPDAPMGIWVHWVIFNMPTAMDGLASGVPSKEVVNRGARCGVNDFGKLGYRGPCPPGGTHRYYFRLYALDAEIDLESGITRRQLLQAMGGHILAEGHLMGKYER
ncbi:MAG: YbhB/YbcL family Raf kinase inhibitor-like protein [Thermodesulfobacteriota bacterium]|nr:YbhB/YbcL family Raf kinase inhibitor-like protein [Thermodesulfobacteriota bacterium]